MRDLRGIFFRGFLFFIFARLLVCTPFSFYIFFLRDFLRLEALKTKKTLEWGMNERLKRKGKLK